ncbi:uncharacterized protein [Syngnathus scovelli]|uniref:uncharacterized protein isoform X1 n=1 Tax=Syngnathus scovelli TaxID=161590 RepID=UPI0035CA01A4
MLALNVLCDASNAGMLKGCICNRRNKLTAKKGFKMAAFMRRLQASELRLERSPVLPCALHWWRQRTNFLQPGSTEVVLVQAIRKRGVMINFLSNIVTASSTSAVEPSTCWAKEFSKIMLKAWQSRSLCNISGTRPAVTRLVQVFSGRGGKSWSRE